MSLTFKWIISVTDALLLSSKINLITRNERSMKIKSLVWLWTLCTGWILISMALRFRWRLRYIWVKKLKIVIIEFYKIVKILRAPWLVKKQPLIAPINPWKLEVCVIKVTDCTFYRFTNVVKVSRCWETIQKKKKKVNQSPPARNYKLFSCSHVGYLTSKLIERAMNKWGKSLKKLWCCVGGRV